MTMSTAFVVFAKAALRNRKIPFEIYDYGDEVGNIATAESERRRQRAIEAFNYMRGEIQERYKDKPEPTLDEINAEIARVRTKRREHKGLATVGGVP